MSVDKYENIIKNMDCHLGRVTLKNLKKWKDDIHQVELSTGEMNTHDEIRVRSIRLAEAIKSRGIGLGDIVILCSDMHNDACLPIIAASYIGYTIFPFSNITTLVEVKRFISLENPKMIICDPYMEEIFTKALHELQLNIEIVIFGGVEKRANITPFSELLKPTGTEDTFEVVDFDPNTTIFTIVSSSGTTGLPKGVCLSYYSTSSINLLAKNEFRYFGPGFCMTFSNFFWASALGVLLCTCLFNTPRLTCRVPFTEEILKNALTKYRPYTILMSPFMLYSIIKHPIFEQMDFSSVKICMLGGGPVSKEGFSTLKSKMTNGEVYIMYGNSEAGYISLLKDYRNASIGKILPWIDWKIVNVDTGEEVGVGEPGELCLKSISLLKCYLNNPEATNEAFDKDGYFKTGDYMTYDEEGILYSIERMKEFIKYKSFAIAPTEIEFEIGKLEDVVQVCVVGKKHELFGDLPVAFIQKKPGSNLKEEDVHNAVNSTLADHKKLRGGIVFLEKMPTTASGKADRRLMKEMAQKLK